MKLFGSMVFWNVDLRDDFDGLKEIVECDYRVMQHQDCFGDS